MNISGWHFLSGSWQTQNDPLKNYTRIIQLPLMVLTIKIFPFSSFRSMGMLFPFGYLLECILLLTWSCQEWMGALPFSALWISVLNSIWREPMFGATFSPPSVALPSLADLRRSDLETPHLDFHSIFSLFPAQHLILNVLPSTHHVDSVCPHFPA